jgi:hypothetical protein
MPVTLPLAAPLSPQKTIPAYPYFQYSDDDDIQAFFAAFNIMTQQYIDWFNAINLPVYTGVMIAGLLLDWVGQGVYNIARPSIPLSAARTIGPFNTWMLNTLPFNARKTIAPTSYVTLNDDYYKRVMTWHLYLGDGKQFCVRWLKRRIMRFLLGTNGTDVSVADTSDVSIVVVAGVYTITIKTTTSTVAAAAILKAAIAAGAVETPFQYTYVVNLTS